MTWDKAHTACFTGHRPEKLPDGGDEDSIVNRALKSMLLMEILEAAREGYTHFLSGMARGYDMWACEAVLEAKKSCPQIQLVCVIPFEGHHSRWSKKETDRLDRFLAQSDEVIVLEKEYSQDCFAKRNAFMVNHASLLIGVCGSPRSGAGQTVRYAKRRGLALRVLSLQP